MTTYKKIALAILIMLFAQPLVFDTHLVLAVTSSKEVVVKKPSVKPAPKPKVKPAPKLKSKPKPALKPKPTSKPVSKPKPALKPKPTSKPVSKPKPVLKTGNKNVDIQKSTSVKPIVNNEDRVAPKNKQGASGSNVQGNDLVAPNLQDTRENLNFWNPSAPTGHEKSLYDTDDSSPFWGQPPETPKSAPSTSVGSGRLAQLLISSPWCTISATNNTSGDASGSSSTTRLQFSSDGSYSQNGERDTASYGYGGTYLGSSTSSGGGRWSAENDQLSLANEATGGQMLTVPVEITSNSNGYPIIKALGTEYFQCE